MNKLSFTITQGKFFTVVYRLPANQLYIDLHQDRTHYNESQPT